MPEIRMLDLKAEFRLFEEDVRGAIESVLKSQQFINGPAVAELEGALARRQRVAHAIAVSSGTDALLCSLMALGIGTGDEVIIPALSFFATAGVVARVGAKPVFVDTDPRTFNINPTGIEEAITTATRAIITVHLFGQCADMDAIRAIAGRHGLAVIEDAAQALGAGFKRRNIGSWGDATCVSFYPTKNLGGFGEGGMILANDDRLAERVRNLRNHGESQRYVHEIVGGNFRLDTLKAAILCVKLRFFDDFTQRRREIAAQYNDLLADTDVVTPYVPEHHEPVYHQYSILCERRDGLRAFLQERGVATGVYYPLPLHLQNCFSRLGFKPGSLPVAEETCRKILSLPCHPMLSRDDVGYVADCIREYRGTGKGVVPAAARAAVRRG